MHDPNEIFASSTVSHKPKRKTFTWLQQETKSKIRENAFAPGNFVPFSRVISGFYWL